MNDNRLSDAESNVDYLTPPENTPQGAQDFSMERQRQEFLGGNSPELKTPYCIALFEKAKKEIPENSNQLLQVFQEIDRQSMDNFHTFTPSAFPGTEISYIKFEITPDVVKKLAQGQTETIADQLPDSEDEVDFLFPAIGKSPDGNAFISQDMGIDRFFRNLPKVARAIKEGKQPPVAEIYMFGTGTGLGEKITSDYVDAIKQDGFDTIGKVYAEFIEKVLTGKDIDNTRVLLQGVSMGAGTGDKTYQHLPDNIRASRTVQRLFDNPTGGHEHTLANKWKAAQIGLGFVGEFVVRKLRDSVAATLDKAKPGFNTYLSEKKGLNSDSSDEVNLKNQLFNAETSVLFKGYDLDTQERTFIRRGVLDPTTTNPLWAFRNRMRQRERSLEAPMKRAHSFTYENFSRWNQILKYCKSVPKTSA